MVHAAAHVIREAVIPKRERREPFASEYGDVNVAEQLSGIDYNDGRVTEGVPHG